MTPFLVLLACLLIPLGYLLFIFLVRNPEIALAVQANGTALYFYFLFKAGLAPSSLLTAGFYFLLAAIYLFGAFLAILEKDGKIRLGTIDALLLGFFLLMPLSTLGFSAHNSASWKKLSYVPLLALAPYLGTCLWRTLENIKKFLAACAFIPALLLFPSFYELSANPVFRAKPRQNSLIVETDRFSLYRFEGIQSNPILLSVMFSVLILIVTIWLFEWKIGHEKWRTWTFVYLLGLVPPLFLVLRIGSRGPLLGLGLALFIYFVCFARLRWRTRLFVLAGLIILGLILYALVPDVISDFYKYTFTAQAKSSPGSSIFWRMTYFRQALSEFIRHPLFGVGFGNSAGGKGYPHNILLETAAEMGLLGLALFTAVCILAFKKVRDVIKKNPVSGLTSLMKIALFLFLFFLTEAMISSQLESNTMLYVSIGLISHLGKMSDENRHG